MRGVLSRMSRLNTVYIGYEPAEAVAYHALVASIIQNCKRPVNIVPLDRRKLQWCHKRPPDLKQSNSFTYTRFLVPYLSEYRGWSLFMDCDMIVREDINEIFDWANDAVDVMCVQHPDYTSSVATKYLGTQQYNYPRKNWSSVMLFNNALCQQLTPNYIDTASPADLHRMKWAKNVGSLPRAWNHLVGEQPERHDARIVHFTLGTPCWPRFRNCEYGDEWELYRNAVNWYLPEDLEDTG